MFGTDSNKCVITVSDKGGGIVGVEVTPSMETLLKKIDSGSDLTPGEEIVFMVLNGVRKKMAGGLTRTGPNGLVLPKGHA